MNAHARFDRLPLRTVAGTALAGALLTLATRGSASDAAAIAGRVVDQRLAPISGVRVDVATPDRVRTVVTDAHGGFAIVGVEPADPVVVSFEKPGFDAVSCRARISAGHSPRVEATMTTHSIAMWTGSCRITDLETVDTYEVR